ncbi:MAG TPA: crosslink repair DNA glycosylase YcaQ family protein, partial [Acidimicrobiia bacterium]|nr:crosslink repair DNA glycosylase YcaQ family protein [Acidimicrobiia bacterium]
MGAKLLRIDDRQRRARLARRHHLAATSRTADVVKIAGDLVGFHGSDPASVFLSAWARLRSPAATVPKMEKALYADRTLVRTLCMRRTIFVLPVEVVPVVQAAVTEALLPGERRRTVQMIEENGIAADGAAWLEELEAATLAELASRGEATGAELGKVVPGLGHQIPVGQGKTWAGTIGMSTRVLFLLSTAQRIVRGRPRGSWTSSQYRWSPIEAWLPDGVPVLDPAAARAELVRGYLSG